MSRLKFASTPEGLSVLEEIRWTWFFFPMHGATLAPDILVPYTFRDYVALRDPLLDRALTLAKQRSR